MTPEEVTMARLDIPRSSGAVRFLFVRRQDSSEHEWWGELFRALTTSRPLAPKGVHSETAEELAEAVFEGPDRERLIALLRAAPDELARTHVTLRSAASLLAKNTSAIRVLCFGSQQH